MQMALLAISPILQSTSIRDDRPLPAGAVGQPNNEAISRQDNGLSRADILCVLFFNRYIFNPENKWRTTTCCVRYIFGKNRRRRFTSEIISAELPGCVTLLFKKALTVAINSAAGIP
jgi:hypothetical protein